MTTQTATMHEFFGWHHHPFTDTRLLSHPFLGQKDKRVLTRAKSLISIGKSFALTGPSGSGKSTLTQYLMTQLDPQHYHPALIHYGGLKRSGILRAIADLLGVDASGRSVPLLVKIQKHLQGLAQQSSRHFPILIVDDAHLMERDSLLDLCSLMVAQPKAITAASIVLIGDCSFAKVLNLHVMAPVRTRLTVNFPLASLDEQESQAFVIYRLKLAKAPDHLFDSEALRLMAAHCQGNRRKLMNMATILLEEAFQIGEKTVGAQLVLNTDLINFND